jgi:hypothetical protein
LSQLYELNRKKVFDTLCRSVRCYKTRRWKAVHLLETGQFDGKQGNLMENRGIH